MNFLALPANPRLRYAVIAGLLFFLLTIALLLSSVRTLYSPMHTSITDADHEVIIIEVVAGSSLSRVVQELSQQGYIQSPLLFKLLARLRGVENGIQTGEYEIDATLSPARLLEKMVAGETIQYRLTLLEGWTLAQAMQAIWSAEKIQRTFFSSNLQDLAPYLESGSENPEGLLFPDTYFYTKGTTDIELVQRANQRLNTVLAAAWDKRLGALPFTDPYEALILASIIEKESANNSERGDIAGVFIRRLELGMRLQSDPTVIYGMGETYTGDIRSTDLALKTAYNTYRIDGLPPSPIALAGLESINAALNPLSSEYLYFVAKGDGSHYFSSSLQEHNQAVNLYQRQAVNQ